MQQSDVAIKISGLSKTYYMQRQRPSGLKSAVLEWLQARPAPVERFEVLRDIELSVAHGESHGLIGANGSGKSTLLKIIARILEPNSGLVQRNGRICALLELGAGFHPDLTGRENVFLNGAILGLTRQEIEERLDSIIAYSGIGEHIDAPVKTYSSGMYVRLGFAIAVHTDPEILLIDEIFAVGDAEFQERCRQTVLDLRRKGVTILFVSHDMDAVCLLCHRATLLHHGKVLHTGPSTEVAREYLRLFGHSSNESPGEVEFPPVEAEEPLPADESELPLPSEPEPAAMQTPAPPPEPPPPTPDGPPDEPTTPTVEEPPPHIYTPQEVLVTDLQRKMLLDLNEPTRFGKYVGVIRTVTLRGEDGRALRAVRSGSALDIDIALELPLPHRVVVGVGLHTPEGLHLSGPNTRLARALPDPIDRAVVRFRLTSLPLHSGEYLLSVAVYDEHIVLPYDHCHKWFPLSVRAARATAEPDGLLVMDGSWQVLAGSPEGEV